MGAGLFWGKHKCGKVRATCIDEFSMLTDKAAYKSGLYRFTLRWANERDLEKAHEVLEVGQGHTISISVSLMSGSGPGTM